MTHRKKLKYKIRRAAAALLAASCIFCSTAAAAEGLGEAMEKLRTAGVIAQTGVSGNEQTIRILLEQCMDVLGEDDPIAATLGSVLKLLDAGSTDAVSIGALLQSALTSLEARDSGEGGEQGEAAAQETNAPQTEAGQQQEDMPPQTAQSETAAPQSQQPETNPPAASQTNPPAAPQTEAPAAPQTEAPANTPLELPPNTAGLPTYEAASFIREILHNTVLVDVPGGWGNNNEEGRTLITYSPVNDSGAISPSAGTLSLSFFPTEGKDGPQAYDEYQRNIASMSVTTSMEAQDITAAELSARKLDFTMNVGANIYTCEVVCFAYEDMMYAIELMQGHESEYDYFPAYGQIVGSAEVGTPESIEAAINAQNQPQTEAPAPEQPTEPATEQTQEPAPSPEEVQFPGDMGSFQYQINGHTYQFPTAVRDLAQEDISLDRSLTIAYDLRSDADMTEGKWTEIANTQIFYFENSLYKEMAGVTNLTGSPAAMDDCMLTALIDTQGDNINITLPGDVRVGGKEEDILRGFPAFSQLEMNGNSGFRGNELMAACNVRDDGCHGYVLVSNDAPYYSAVSIICDNGVIREISFECIGSAREADANIFLDEEA